MNVKKMITDKKPSICMACPLSVLHACGKEITKRGSSGAVFKLYAPDNRCKIKVDKRN